MLRNAFHHRARFLFSFLRLRFHFFMLVLASRYAFYEYTIGFNIKYATNDQFKIYHDPLAA